MSLLLLTAASGSCVESSDKVRSLASCTSRIVEECRRPLPAAVTPTRKVTLIWAARGDALDCTLCWFRTTLGQSRKGLAGCRDI